MNQKGFVNILLIVIIVALAGVGVYFVATHQAVPTPIPNSTSTPTPTPSPIPTPKPSPTPQPSPKPISSNCTADSQCPANYICEASQSMGTACAMNSNGQPVDPNCMSSTTIIKGSCKVKQGYSCSTNSDCALGNLCHAGLCTSPVGKVCNYSGDPICGADYKCIQDCGPPVSRGDEPPPGWHCILNEQAAQPGMCPICLSAKTLIDTPRGSVSVKDLQVGMPIWTTTKSGRRVSGIVEKTSRVPVSPTHQMVHLILNDGREVFVSPPHPTIDGRTVGDLVVNDLYNGARIVSSERVIYGDVATYDILPSGETGFYWADGILLDNTLH